MAEKHEFDENDRGKMDLYSRALAALGVDTMKNLSQLSVLIIGLRGVGVETAKNMILAGPKEVVIIDDTITQIADLGSNFYLKEEHVGKTSRALACLRSLSELNPYVMVSSISGTLTDEKIQSFGAIVVTETLPKKELFRINHLCRTRTIGDKLVPTAFILAVTHGVSAHFFSDFGDAHLVNDLDGEPTRSLVIDHIDAEGVITVAAKQHGFDDGDEIRIEEIEGETPGQGQEKIEHLNGLQGIKIKRIYYDYTYKDANGKEETRQRQSFNQLKLDLSGTTLTFDKLTKWKTGGIITEVKPTKIFNFRSLEASFQNPAHDAFAQFLGPQHPDQGQWEQGVGKTLHLAFQTALNFQEKYGFFPRLHNQDDANNFVVLFEELNKANKQLAEKDEPGIFIDNVDKKRLKAYSWYHSAELTGYCAFLGGVAAQEVVKKFGKYTPVFQWLHSDHIQLIGNQIPSDAVPQNCRYDHQISIFGKAFQYKLSNQKIFLVGCGALGCEYLKGLSLMGVCSGPQGKLWCTDMDRIEVSNLSRQFLFRSKHVGKPKSKTAAEAAKEMNHSFNVEALELKVWEETEDVYDDAFWDNLDLCWNALDNVHARKYTDSKCLFHGKPLLESGTQGTKCNSEIIIPYKTKSYNDGEEQETEGIPMCTLQNFPYIIEHCIEWARSSFSGLFENAPKTFNTFLENKPKFFDQVRTAQGEEQLQMLQTVKKFYSILSKNPSIEDCVQLAFEEFVQQFITRIKNLVHWFPKDERVKDPITGEEIGLFWSGHKRFPQIPKFSLDDPLIGEYLFCGANLYAFMFNLKQIPDYKTFIEHCKKLNLQEPNWEIPKGNKVNVNEDEEKKTPQDNNTPPNDEHEQAVQNLVNELSSYNLSSVKKLKETEFEKDDDTNFHIDFIKAAANSRAWNYRIKDASRHKIKIIAGKIIAALATTTAMITGLVELEYYKLVLGLYYINEDAFYNANINLAVSQFQYFQPDSAIRNIKHDKKDLSSNTLETIVPYPDLWTTWDKLIVNEGNLTIQEFVDLFPKIFWGITVKLLHKIGKMEKGQVLYNSSEVLRNSNMQKTLLARPNVSETQKKILEQQLQDIEKWNSNVKAGRDSKLIDRYIELYGKLISNKRNYVILHGAFEDANGFVANIPPIKYIFKN